MDTKIVELPANIVKGFTTEKELFGFMESKLKIDSVAEVDDELQIDATITNGINSLKICTFQGDFNEATEHLREAEGREFDIFGFTFPKTGGTEITVHFQVESEQ